MKKITDILENKEQTFSFEFFPPKEEAGVAGIYQTASELVHLGADFFSVTYGAGGSSNKTTLDIAVELQRRFGRPVIHHLTSIGHNCEQLRGILAQIKRAGICNILAMRGDPPRDNPSYQPSPDEPRFGYQLVQICREFGDSFAVGVPGFPEGHTQTPTKELDSRYLKIKQDAGAEFVITQLFFDNQDYYDYVERCRQVGVTMRLIPGIFPITDYPKLVRFCRLCGAKIPEFVSKTFETIVDDPEATYKRGMKMAIEQCQDLLAHGAPGLHFFCLNKLEPTATIFRAVTKNQK